eukprot:105512-Chlamydomonas_euryale.AAC.1
MYQGFGKAARLRQRTRLLQEVTPGGYARRLHTRVLRRGGTPVDYARVLLQGVTPGGYYRRLRQE